MTAIISLIPNLNNSVLSLVDVKELFGENTPKAEICRGIINSTKYTIIIALNLLVIMYLAIVAIVLSFINVHSSLLGLPFIKWLNKPTKREEELTEDRNRLLMEQNRINIMDDFAKHSKIQRKINAINQEFNEIKACKTENSFYVQMFFTYGLKVLSVISLAFLSIYFRYTPVFYLERNINLFPLSGFITYPNEGNAVSLYFWILCCSAVARLIKL